MRGKTESDLEQFLLDCFSKFGVCTIVFLRQQLAEKIESGKYSSLQTIADDTFRTHLNKLADSLHGAYYLRVHPDDSINEVSLSLFLSHSSIPLNLLNHLRLLLPHFLTLLFLTLPLAKITTWRVRSPSFPYIFTRFFLWM